MGFRRLYPPTETIFNSSNLKNFSEIGFIFEANGLKVVVWTTWEKADSMTRIRNSDAGWVIILDNERTVYFSHPIHRTKNFLQNLLYQVQIAWWRVLHRPKCPECDEFMDIAFGKGLKSRYWKCSRRLRHSNRKSINCPWDVALPSTIKNYLKSLRGKRARYFKKRRREGKDVCAAMKKRWKRKQYQKIFY